MSNSLGNFLNLTTFGESLDGVITVLGPSEVFRVPQGAKHRLENKGSIPLTIIEIQYGTYFGEDDIIRLDDDYNRQ